MLDERQKDGAGSSNDGFYESRREWMGRRHFILAYEGYVLIFWVMVNSLFFCLSRKND
jgi:hypothetical protein